MNIHGRYVYGYYGLPRSYRPTANCNQLKKTRLSHIIIYIYTRVVAVAIIVIMATLDS